MPLDRHEDAGLRKEAGSLEAVTWIVSREHRAQVIGSEEELQADTRLI